MKIAKLFTGLITYSCLLLFMIAVPGCNNNGGSPAKEKDDKALVVDSMGKLYAWANPLSATKYLDHTWVTSTGSV
ncbi:MAG TPA: hypothetical protein VK489_13385, partial [Ferruginibacter sp.]|nr:hypothetical protein [Ferruginibacter sp.]